MRIGKKTFICLLVCLLCAMLALTSCETSIFGASLTYVTPVEGTWENERYLVWRGRLSDVLVDKENGTVYPLRPERDDRVAEGVRVSYDYTDKYIFTDTELRWHTYLSVPKFDVDTGSVTHYVYYPTVVVFDYTGKEISRDGDLTEMTEEAVKEQIGKADDTLFSYAKEVGSGRDRYEGEEAPTYTPAQQKAVDYAYALENQYRDEYHLTFGEGFERDGKVYFSVTRSNQKAWASQSATVQGIYHTAVMCYDAASDAFETLYESSKREEILLFDEGNVLVRNGNTVYTYAYESGKSEKVYTLGDGDYYSLESSRSILHVSRMVTVRGTPAGNDGYASFSYPCDLHTFITVDGEIVAEDYDLTAEEKEAVTKAKNVEYKEW